MTITTDKIVLVDVKAINKLVQLAKDEAGNGPAKYRKWYYGSEQYGVPWCAVFVSWCLSQIGITSIKTDGAGCFARNYGKYGKWYESEYSDSSITPQAGDIVTFVWNYAGRYSNQDKYYSDHVGIVYAVDSNYIYTVEGNAGNTNDTSTVKLKSYSRKNGCINGYFRLYTDTTKTESEETEMNFKKGDKSDGVLAYKSLIMQADALNIIDASVDNSNSFGDGTYKATVLIQKKFNLEVDGVAGIKTITALRNAINKELKSVQKPTEISNGWGIGIRFLKICLRVLQTKGVIKTKPDTKFGYGSGTNKAIKELQTVAGIEVDGIAGEQTANAIEKYLIKE